MEAEVKETKKVFVVTNDDGEMVIAFEDEQECIDYCMQHDDAGWQSCDLVIKE